MKKIIRKPYEEHRKAIVKMRKSIKTPYDYAQ